MCALLGALLDFFSARPLHTTWHLFNCPAKPTPLTVLSLWKQPEQAAAFLGLIPVAQDEDIDVD